jgi:hydroxymethylbilane synthase
MRVIRIGSRGSALARWQSHHIAARLAAAVPGVRFAVVEISSTGDQVADVPLSHLEGTGFFTATIERALLDGEVDVAVHSYKDLPVVSTAGLEVGAVPTRGPVEDVLCARDGMTLQTLPPGARLGTCSARRTAQVKAARPDLDVRSLRGNVPTRVGRVTSGELDAIVLARAGLMRLGLEAHITEVFSIEQVLPAPAQGALAVQCRAGDDAILSLLSRLDDAETRGAVDAERTLLHALGGGCSVPVGALATYRDRLLTLDAGVFGIAPAIAVRVREEGEDPTTVGEAAARRLLDAGAGGILAEFNKTARLNPPTLSGDIS